MPNNSPQNSNAAPTTSVTRTVRNKRESPGCMGSRHGAANRPKVATSNCARSTSILPRGGLVLSIHERASATTEKTSVEHLQFQTRDFDTTWWKASKHKWGAKAAPSPVIQYSNYNGKIRDFRTDRRTKSMRKSADIWLPSPLLTKQEIAIWA